MLRKDDVWKASRTPKERSQYVDERLLAIIPDDKTRRIRALEIYQVGVKLGFSGVTISKHLNRLCQRGSIKRDQVSHKEVYYYKTTKGMWFEEMMKIREDIDNLVSTDFYETLIKANQDLVNDLKKDDKDLETLISSHPSTILHNCIRDLIRLSLTMLPSDMRDPEKWYFGFTEREIRLVPREFIRNRLGDNW